jgi:hypothetical protein
MSCQSETLVTCVYIVYKGFEKSVNLLLSFDGWLQKGVGTRYRDLEHAESMFACPRAHCLVIRTALKKTARTGSRLLNPYKSIDEDERFLNTMIYLSSFCHFI